MKTLRLFALAILAIALMSLGAMTVSAAGPINTGNPMEAQYIPSQTQTIQGNSELWYRYEYDGNRSQVTLRIPSAPDGLTVQVHNPASMESWWSSDPIGVLSWEGNDMVWSGNSNESGTYYVQIDNENAFAVNFSLVLTGDHVRTAPLPPAPAENLPGEVVAPTNANIDPYHAIVVDNSAHMLPGSASLWYRFDYFGGNDRDLITITMINGKNSGMGFKVWTPDDIAKWWENEAIGQGTPKENDLLWAGSFNTSDTYYVQVFNNNSYPLEFTLTISGRTIY